MNWRSTQRTLGSRADAVNFRSNNAEQRGFGGGGVKINFDISKTNAVNASSQLLIDTYVVGNDELVHPSVLYFKNGWNGYKYWMAFTPTPGGDAADENPSICVSNDGETWIIPDGVTNPIVAKPPTGYNADPCLYMNYDNTIMYCAYKQEYSGYNIRVIQTSDGITWTNDHAIITEPVRKALSVSVIKESGKYVMFAVDSQSAPYKISKYESLSPATGWAWVEYVGTPASDIWHLEVRKIDNYYYIIYSSTGNLLYITKSADMLTFDTPVRLLRKDIWSTGFYKGSFIVNTTNDGFDFYYGVRSPLWLIGRTNIDFNGKKFVENLTTGIATASVAKGDIVWDSFNRADNLSLGNAESGQTWQKVGGGFKIVSNQITPTATGLNHAYINAGVANFIYKINFVANAGESWVTFRFTNSSNFWRFNGFQLQKIVAGAITTVSTNGEYINGDVITIICNGDNIKTYCNDVLVNNITDGFNNIATNVGVQSNSLSCIFDSVLVSNIT